DCVGGDGQGIVVPNRSYEAGTSPVHPTVAYGGVTPTAETAGLRWPWLARLLPSPNIHRFTSTSSVDTTVRTSAPRIQSSESSGRILGVGVSGRGLGCCHTRRVLDAPAVVVDVSGVAQLNRKMHPAATPNAVTPAEPMGTPVTQHVARKPGISATNAVAQR